MGLNPSGSCPRSGSSGGSPHSPETAVYARVTAEHKLRIMRAWKANGSVVAAAGAIPLVVLELVKVVRNRKRDASPDAQAMKTG